MDRAFTIDYVSMFADYIRMKFSAKYYEIFKFYRHVPKLNSCQHLQYVYIFDIINIRKIEIHKSNLTAIGLALGQETDRYTKKQDNFRYFKEYSKEKQKLQLLHSRNGS